MDWSKQPRDQHLLCSNCLSEDEDKEEHNEPRGEKRIGEREFLPDVHSSVESLKPDFDKFHNYHHVQLIDPERTTGRSKTPQRNVNGFINFMSEFRKVVPSRLKLTAAHMALIGGELWRQMSQEQKLMFDQNKRPRDGNNSDSSSRSS